MAAAKTKGLPTAAADGSACGSGLEAARVRTDMRGRSVDDLVPGGQRDRTPSKAAHRRPQINAGSDGGGPGRALLDTTGTGNDFKAISISKNFADGGANSKNAMTLVVPPGTTCAGGACLLRVRGTRTWLSLV
jgi:hypothetical protein